MNDFQVQIGSVDQGKTFVRVVHLPTGKDRMVVGLGELDARDVEARLIGELESEIEAEKRIELKT